MNRLRILLFLQFSVWGAYLTCLGQFLGPAGLGRDIQWFYTAVGIVSLVMPALMGNISDRWVMPQRLLAFCHLAAACFMALAWLYARTHAQLEFWPFFLLYLAFLAFYQPSIALANVTCFSLIRMAGREPRSVFPGVRMFGTLGFIAAMLFVNCFYFHDGAWGLTMSETSPMARYRFQYTDGMLLVSSILGFATFLYTLTLPRIAVYRSETHARKLGFIDLIGWRAFTLFRKRRLAVFFIFAILAGVCLQITNGYATPFITHFVGMPEYSDSFAAGNANLLFSLSQISELLCVLLIPFFLKRFGIKWTIATSLLAWSLRFALFGWGNPGDGLWMLILSMVVYGVAFNFFNIAGALYIEKEAPQRMKGASQGILMLMSNGVGATLGMMGAGAIVNRFCHWTMVDGRRLFMGDWETPWLIFAGYALAICVLFLIFFPGRKGLKSERVKE